MLFPQLLFRATHRDKPPVPALFVVVGYFFDGSFCATQGEISRVSFFRNSKFFQMLGFYYSNSLVLMHSNNILSEIKSIKTINATLSGNCLQCVLMLDINRKNDIML